MTTTRPVALVTGGSRGIGLGIAAALAAEGYDLVVNGVRPAADVEPALEGLRAGGGDVLYVPADISRAEDRDRLVDASRERFAHLDLLVNNAGVAPRARVDVLDATEEEFDRVWAINVKGPWFLTQLIARWMLTCQDAPRQSTIVNIGSVSADVVSTERGEYCVSKAALGMATQVWAARLAGSGVAVYEIRPGIIRTDMTAAAKEKYDRLIEGDLLLEPRWGEPEDIGRAVCMLARGDLPYAPGQVLTMDGGLTLRRL